MIRIIVVPTTDTSWGLDDKYDLHHENIKEVYMENVLGDEVRKMQKEQKIEIISGEKYI